MVSENGRVRITYGAIRDAIHGLRGGEANSQGNEGEDRGLHGVIELMIVTVAFTRRD